MSSLLATPSNSTTLDKLQVGDSALVTEVSENIIVSAKSSFDVVRRLKELGFVKGESVKILHRGYFGGEPLAVRIGQSTFALRRFEAALIGVAKAGIA
ncbi:FeoA family protein [Undibacterium sp. RTI2.1]|uniref:FeoA family protein n=1 Tax=unclassified Undibacterium TaxID=2630295 RepID=UPI002AB5AA68|nr:MULTISPECIES: FeoA family protein [unclassified Undibacterium]MDY7537909.1 FeoA family protein [Undibacterium sp. 5I1]MEB0032587.1 FeoA family protein [Undibacterium sp. RTI2.1]MEB0118644.1 FeoA family protein [Undibacterium sp. RTI2.2]MEB0232489.1 FeoA family protein [Undibacterium sp. 10I3]MEB0259565.1 FeoA family protein [Undibacterium sp. 5I1]